MLIFMKLICLMLKIHLQAVFATSKSHPNKFRELTGSIFEVFGSPWDSSMVQSFSKIPIAKVSTMMPLVRCERRGLHRK